MRGLPMALFKVDFPGHQRVGPLAARPFPTKSTAIKATVITL